MSFQNKGVALEYSGDVPRIIAIARGILLDKLLEIAIKNNITIYKDPDLAQILSELDVGAEIPEDLFKAVSEVLAFCYKINKDFKNKMDNIGLM